MTGLVHFLLKCSLIFVNTGFLNPSVTEQWYTHLQCTLEWACVCHRLVPTSHSLVQSAHHPERQLVPISSPLLFCWHEYLLIYLLGFSFEL